MNNAKPWIIALTCFALPSCVAATPDPDVDPDGGAGGGGEQGSSSELLRRPTCIALSPDIYRTYYRYCGDWHESTPIASVCDGDPAPDQCAAFESYQRYDGMFCCCDPAHDASCDVHH